MRDPFTWSFPLGRLFGIAVRVHILFPLVALGLVLRIAFHKDAIAGVHWVDAVMVVGLLFLAVLLHEFGHCFAARWVDGDAQEILMWPLGGLAYVEVPHTPRANLITVLGGPAVNLFLCVACCLVLTLGFSYWPSFDPFEIKLRTKDALLGAVLILGRVGGGPEPVPDLGIILLARFFWVNWFLMLLNVVLIGYPLDGGRIFQSILWRYVGYRQATLAAVFAGFITMIVVGLYAIVNSDMLALCLAIFIYVACKQQWILLETGGEESLFGYDFSQGYTSLERDQPAQPAQRRPGWFQRWLQRRAARRLQRELEQEEAEERRMDELLVKVQQRGLSALTDEERRFMARISAKKKRNRQ